MINLSAVDRLFIAANVALVKKADDDNAENLFVRYEFLEWLIRISELKYRQTKVLSTVAECFKKLLAEHVMPFHDEYCHDLEIFRETYLLKNIVDHKFF